MAIELLFDGPEGGPVLVLAHGAGAAMDSPFMEVFAKGLGERGLRAARFEFPYMVRRRTEGRRGAPDREAVLLDTWRAVVRELGGGERCFVGGKSMGGRMASMVADELSVRGLVCLGYPFHAPGRPEKPRVAHLEALRTPALIVQGTRDQFGTRDDVAGYTLSPSITFHWLEDGDHSLEPRKGVSGRGKTEAWAEAMDVVAEFVRERA
ncbi:MAG: alpha/beta family hydrolase [Dehalococcoidia bacterium]